MVHQSDFLFSLDLFHQGSFSLWHPTLCVISAVNVVILVYLIGKRKQFGKLQFCCVVYTLVTSYRSVFPRDVLYKTCFVEIDHILFSPIADRTLAALAELCFSMQQVLWTKTIADQLKAKFQVPGVENVAKNVFYVIFFAQILCFCGVFTGYPLFHALENSLWGVCTGLILLDSITFYWNLRPKLHTDTKFFLKIIIVTGVSFIGFLVLHDIPIWVRLAFHTTKVNPPNIGFQQSLKCRFTQAYDDWSHNIYWLLMYNTVAIWSSMYIGFFDLQLGGFIRTLSRSKLHLESNLGLNLERVSSSLKLNMQDKVYQLKSDFKKMRKDFETMAELLSVSSPSFRSFKDD